MVGEKLLQKSAAFVISDDIDYVVGARDHGKVRFGGGSPAVVVEKIGDCCLVSECPYVAPAAAVAEGAAAFSVAVQSVADVGGVDAVVDVAVVFAFFADAIALVAVVIASSLDVALLELIVVAMV